MLTPKEMSQLFKAMTVMNCTSIYGNQLVSLQDILELLCLYSDGNPMVRNVGLTWSLQFQDIKKPQEKP